MDGIKNGSDISEHVVLPDSMQNANYTWNFGSVSSYEITEINNDLVYVSVDPGLGRKCVKIVFRKSKTEPNKVICGGSVYNAYLGKYILDAWESYENGCR